MIVLSVCDIQRFTFTVRLSCKYVSFRLLGGECVVIGDNRGGGGYCV